MQPRFDIAAGATARGAPLDLSAHRAIVATAVVSAAVTVVFATTSLEFAVVRPELRVALETAQAIVALLTALLLYGRSSRSGTVGDLALVAGLFLLGTTNLFYATVLGIAPTLNDETFGRFQVWYPLVMRLMAAILLAWAALGETRHHHLRHPGATVIGSTLTGAAAIGGVMAMATALLPDPLISLDESSRPQVEGHPSLIAAQVLLTAVWAAAAAGFTRRHLVEPIPMLLALAVGSILGAFSRINFLLYPSLYTDVVHIGDVFRLLLYAVLASGAATTIVGYWRADATAAAVAERERLASELHDGLAQELAFLRSHLSSMAAASGQTAIMSHLSQAAERALAESRRIVRVLDPAGGEQVEVAVARAVRELTGRAGIDVDIRCEPDLGVTPARALELANIAREATNNAIRHGAATRITIRLGRAGDGVVLSVSDDGLGFDPTARAAGYGIRSMRRRARALGGQLRVTSQSGSGTTIELELR